MKQKTRENSQSIPLAMKKKLLEIAGYLPAAARSQFVRNTSQRIGGLVAEHPRTILYGAGGWLLGEALDNLLTFNLPLSGPTISLTGDVASGLGGVAGTLYGFCVDRGKAGDSNRIAKIVREEFQNAQA